MQEALENTFGALALALTDDVNAALAAKGLLPSEFEAIGHLGHAPGLTITDLSSAIALSHAATVRLVARLEAKGVVSREKSNSDGRSVVLRLNATGLELHGELLAERHKKLRSALRVLTKEEQKTLSELTDRILRKMLRTEQHAFRVCRLCNQPICKGCPVETEMMEREAQ